MRRSYAFLIGRQDDLQVSRVSTSVRDLACSQTEEDADLLVLGWTPHGPASDVPERVREHCPDRPLLVVSAGNLPDHARRIRKAGGRYLSRSRVLVDIIPCIRRMLNISPGRGSSMSDASSRSTLPDPLPFSASSAA